MITEERVQSSKSVWRYVYTSLQVVLIGALTFCEDSTSQSYLTDVMITERKTHQLDESLGGKRDQIPRPRSLSDLEMSHAR